MQPTIVALRGLLCMVTLSDCVCQRLLSEQLGSWRLLKPVRTLGLCRHYIAISRRLCRPVPASLPVATHTMHTEISPTLIMLGLCRCLARTPSASTWTSPTTQPCRS
jgi:hypothetical protein